MLRERDGLNLEYKDIPIVLDQFHAEDFSHMIEAAPPEDRGRIDLYVFLLQNQCILVGRLLQFGAVSDDKYLPMLTEFVSALEDARSTLASPGPAMEEVLVGAQDRTSKAIEAMLEMKRNE